MSSKEDNSTIIAMMVWNTCENDSRVIKEATSLAASGYDVTVVCLAAPHLPLVEARDGVTYQRVERVLGRLRVATSAAYRTVVRSLMVLIGVTVGVATLTALIGLGWLMWRWLASTDNTSLAALALTLVVIALAALPVARPKSVTKAARYTRARIRHATARAQSTIEQLSVGKRLVLGLYRILTFRLVHASMREIVETLRPAIIHAHDLQTLPAAVRISRVIGATVVYDSHELATHVSTRPPLPLRWWMAWRERRAIPSAAKVITVSEGIADHLKRRYRLETVSIVLNSPPTLSTSSSTSTVRQDLGLSDEVPLVLYVGAPAPNRGLEQTVDALPLLPQHHLACVGPRASERERSVQERAQLKGCEGRLHFLDPVAVERIVHYLSSADVGIIAIQNVSLSYWYTMPNKLFETVLAGVPVVVADLPHLRDFVERHNVGLVADATEPASLADAVKAVHARPDLKPSGEGLVRLRREYGWETQAAQLLALYSDLRPS